MKRHVYKYIFGMSPWALERLWRRLCISNTGCLCVYAVTFAQHCMPIKCSVLINYYGNCGETDL